MLQSNLRIQTPKCIVVMSIKSWSSSVEGGTTLRLYFPYQLKARLFNKHDAILVSIKMT